MLIDNDAWQPNLTLMNPEKIERLHNAATRILEQTGLNVHHPAMRRELAAAGAKLGEGPRVRIPVGMVEQALSTARREVTVYNRLGESAMRLQPHRIYFGTGSDLIFTCDVQTEVRRQSVCDDVAQSARLCDALEEIDFVMSFALPGDVANRDIEPQQYHAILRNTVKPVIMTSFSGLETLERMHEMACLIAGGESAFRLRPNYIMYGQFISPLQHDLLAVERLIFCADHEVPLIYIPTIMPGNSGPITLAGSLALAIAESLAGLVMHQIRRPGAPFIFGSCVSRLDMRTMLFLYGSPEWRLNDLVMAELARNYNLPVFGTGGATDSKLLDAQAGAEYASSLLVAALAGTNLIHDIGYLDSGCTGSLESIVLGAEQIRWVKKFLNGFEFSPDELALETIDRVGPAGDFLGEEHTLKYLRQTICAPYVLDHVGFEEWVSKGAKSYGARAREYARQTLESHRPPALERSLETALQRLSHIE